ncbi:MAG: flagellar basal body L-ring protein FlgH [candidate division WS1 bacterium]|jgi:flagellar L-ring protein precursor FlgH|nr:flagellar basal body L-ring protein FlgH [candidate division WS1 bacterium]
MMRAIVTITGVLLLAGTIGCAEPGDGTFFSSLYGDHRACAPGDILFVVISEAMSASHSATSSDARSADAEIGPGAGWLDFIPLMGYSGELNASASGVSRRSNVLSARVAVTVIGYTPEGNLIISGERTVRVNDEMQSTCLTGEVRPQDVRPDNTVLSQHVANAAIEYQGPEPGRPGKRVGIITRILGWLF